MKQQRSKVPFIPSHELPPYMSRPDEIGPDLTEKALRTVSQHPDICICSGIVPDQNELYKLAEHFDGVLLIFQNISDELMME